MVKKTNSKFKAIILAGGSGERFWPLSTPEKPKQFLRVFGGESLIRQSVNRLKGLVRPQDVFVVTSQALVAATRKELSELPKQNIIGEPMRRDTGAAVALGVAAASGSGAEGAVLGFFSSDQMVMNAERFRKTVAAAIARAKRVDTIVTIGIKPEYPATSFGYVDPKRGGFVEKPDAQKARAYLRKGYLWNAGMFIGREEVFRQVFAEYAPELEELVNCQRTGTSVVPVLQRTGTSVVPALQRTGTSVVPAGGRLKKLYEKLPRISFDYAVMEKLPRVEVVKGDFGWDDVGSYGAFDKYFPHDARGNVREGPCTVVEAESNICVARSARISLLGVKNLVVVTTPDAVLVADKSRISEMKKLFVSKVKG